MKKILLIFGTRPEAIKMAPLIKELESRDCFNVKVCVTGQHREMLDQVLSIFKIEPDFDLDVMRKNQSLPELLTEILLNLENVFASYDPDLVLVHGDTASTFAGALASYYHQKPVGHIEAGLRTENIFSPWPEEANRKLTGALTKYHFAPTDHAKSNLLNEGVDPENIFVTGNTVIDALFLGKEIISLDKALLSRILKDLSFLDNDRKKILVTGHRRESFGEGFDQICLALKNIAIHNPNVQIIYPVHLNPNVHYPVTKLLSNVENIFLIPPLEYLPFIYLMDYSDIILTDSGGIQEEAPSLGKPVLVMRETTERPEAIETGTVRLVGTNPDKIFREIQKLLDNPAAYESMSKKKNPYGDGNACKKICNILEERLYDL